MGSEDSHSLSLVKVNEDYAKRFFGAYKGALAIFVETKK